MSITVTSSAPIGSDTVSIRAVEMPRLRAVAVIFARPARGEPLPMAIDSLMATVLSEWARAAHSGNVPICSPS